MTSLADIIIPLAGSISNEKAIAIRKACDGLESSIPIVLRTPEELKHAPAVNVPSYGVFEELAVRVAAVEARSKTAATDALHALERVAALESSKHVHGRCLVAGCVRVTDSVCAYCEDHRGSEILERVKELAVRVGALESSMSKVRERTYEIVREEIQRATTRTCEKSGCSAPSVARYWPYYCATHAREFDDFCMGRATTNTGEGATVERAPDAEKAPRCPSPAPSASEIPAWVPSADEIAELLQSDRALGEPDDYARADKLRRLIASRAPRASTRRLSGHCPYCSWMGSPRSTIAEIDADAISHAETCAVNPRRELERRLAELESAPRPSTVSVEEMAERLYEANRALPTWERNPSTCELTQKARDYFRSLARSALSALPASEAPQPSRAADPLVVAAHSAELSDLDNRVSKLEQPSRAAQPAPASTPDLTDAEANRLYDEAEPVPFSATDVERFVRTTVDPQAEVLALQKQRNDVYEERDRLVCALSKCFPSWLARHPDTDKAWDDDWRWIVFVELPNGQATWHIQDRELPWFSHLERRTENVWDGHTTEEKYRRLALLRPASTPDEGDARLKLYLAVTAAANLDGWDAMPLSHPVWTVLAKAALSLSSSRTPRVDVLALLRAYYRLPNGSTQPFSPQLEADMTAALKSQGVECVGEKESAA